MDCKKVVARSWQGSTLEDIFVKIAKCSAELSKCGSSKV